jgi:large subunit ribosomal protein L25
MTITLTVEKRDDKAKSADALRNKGILPGVVYGPKQEATPLAIDKKTFEKVLKEAGESTIVSLEGLDEATEVLIHDVAFDAHKGGVIHVDFYAIERGKELTVDVPLEFIGEAPIEKTGATANKVLHEIEVTCLPRNLPSHIDVDISVLVDEESAVHVKDLVIPEGVKVENDPEDVVVNVSAAREEEPEEVSEVDMDAIEVEQKGKEEGGEGSAEDKE